MSESKIHVLPDENLGGVLREYVEVDRHPRIGDYVYVSKMDGEEVSEIAKVINDDFDNDFSYETIQLDRLVNGENLMIASNPEDRFTTLEPTDIVRIYESDDICGMYVRYRLVDRKAKVGEKVIVVEDFAYGKVGEIHTIKKVYRDVYTTDKASIMRFGRCLVLEPVEPAEEGDDVLTVDETEAPRSVLDLLANLARRVTELERKLGEYARKIDGIEADIQNINIDLGTVEETTKELERKLGETNKSQESSETHIFDVIHRIQNEINGMDDKIEMILDDIVTLDERTQPLVKPFGEESPFATVATIPTFKYSELIGKTLKIYGGCDGEYATVFGYDESTGKSYVLFSGKEGGESR